MSDKVITISDQNPISVVNVAEPLINVNVIENNVTANIQENLITVSLLPPEIITVKVEDQSPIQVIKITEQGPPGPVGPQGPQGPPGPSGTNSISKSISYNGDGTVNVVSDSQGSKTMSYSSGKIINIAGSGIYPSKSLIYSGDKLINVVVA